jgi:hypothetical protein
VVSAVLGANEAITYLKMHNFSTPWRAMLLSLSKRGMCFKCQHERKSAKKIEQTLITLSRWLQEKKPDGPKKLSFEKTSTAASFF